MEGLKFETEINPLKLKQLWNNFLRKKYHGRVPKKIGDKDWDEFLQDQAETIKEIIVNKIHPEISEKDKGLLKKEIVVRIEKDYLSAG